MCNAMHDIRIIKLYRFYTQNILGLNANMVKAAFSAESHINSYFLHLLICVHCAWKWCFQVPERLLTDSKTIFNSFSVISCTCFSPTIQNMTQINMQKRKANFTEQNVSQIFTSRVQCELLRRLKTVLDIRSKT